MKHQWNREDVHIEDMKVIFCAACGSSARVSSGLVGVATVVSECSATETTETSTTDSTVALELISPDVLTQITEDLWVNPSHVVFLKRDGRKTVLGKSDGTKEMLFVELPEAVARVNGSA